MIGEKKVAKNFQYDTPDDLVITYLSEVHIYMYIHVHVYNVITCTCAVLLCLV